jgi:hypothetical protein
MERIGERFHEIKKPRSVFPDWGGIERSTANMRLAPKGPRLH